jgi:hypothetical protein
MAQSIGIFLNSTYYCTVAGNGVVTNGSGITDGTAAGITISGSSNTITGNTSTNNDGGVNQNWGVNEISGNNNCIVGNTVANNSSGGVNTVGANTNVSQPAGPVGEALLCRCDYFVSDSFHQWGP